MIKKVTNLILILLMISCSSNKNVRKIEFVTFQLPKGAMKIDNEKLNNSNKKDQKITQLEYLYKINDIYIGLSQPFKGVIKEEYLKTIKNGFDYDYNKFDFIKSHEYKSNIEKINNNAVLLIYSFHENIGQYSFKILKTDNTEIIGGTIVFENQSDYNEATKVLYNFLNSVKFK